MPQQMRNQETTEDFEQLPQPETEEQEPALPAPVSSLPIQQPLSPAEMGLHPALIEAATADPALQAAMNQPALRPPLPPAPASQDPRQQLLGAIAAGLMLGLGPRSGAAGLGTGLAAAQQQIDLSNLRRYGLESTLYRTRLAQQEADRRKAAEVYARRQQQFMSGINTIKRDLETQQINGFISGPDDYNQALVQWADRLRAGGFRVNGEWMQQAFGRYDPQNPRQLKARQGRATIAFDNFIKLNPRIADDPEQIEKAELIWDRDVPGRPVRVSLVETSQLAGKPFAIIGGKFTLLGGKHAISVEQSYNDLEMIARAEGRFIGDPVHDAKVRESIRAQAKAGNTDFDEYVRRIEAERGYPLNPDEYVAEKHRFTPNYGIVLQQATEGDAPAIAAGIKAGDIQPDTSGLNPVVAGRVRAILAKDKYDLSAAITDWRATQNYFRSANATPQLRLRQAIDFTRESLTIVEQLAREWQGGQFAPLNKANIVLAKTGIYGPRAASIATRIDSQIADLVSELATVYRGGYSSTDKSLEISANNLKAEWSERVLLDNVALVRQNLTLRENSIKNVGAIASPSNPYMPAQPLIPGEAVPDLSGLTPGTKRTFTAGPFQGQSWTIDANGRPRRLK